MAKELSPSELAEINEKLPPQYAALKDKYPVQIVNVADDWDTPPYPNGYVPQDIEVYYHAEGNGGDLYVRDGKLKSISLDSEVNDPEIIAVEIDGNWAYIQIEGRVILNRIGGAIFPDFLSKPDLLLRAIIAKIKQQ